MEFELSKKEDITDRQKQKYNRNDIDIAYKFAKEVHKEFGHFLKAIVLFGSSVKPEGSQEGDIDILLVIDDVTYSMTGEVVETYRIIVENIILKVSKRIHITTLKFTSFWDYIRMGDPVGLNILRDGVALIDTGFFTPLQFLLFEGRVRPSSESMMSYMARAPQALQNSRWHLVQATLDLYWAVIDAAQAAIMKSGRLPPTPAKASGELKYLVKEGLIYKDAPKTMDLFYKLSKSILHKKTLDVSGKDYEFYYKKSKEFVDNIKKYVTK